MNPSKPHYRAFISYSHRDAKWAKWLHRSLERYVVPLDAYPPEEQLEADGSKRNRRLTPVFRDRDELPAAGSLSDTIQQALESSENLVVLCSPNSAASQYVNAEIEIFRGLHPDNDKKIYALIIEGEPPECFPPALIADGAEPIAADAREEGDGKGDSKLKIIAGMLGVGFDRLKQREAKRQRNRLLATVATVSAVAVMASGLAIWALKAEREADQQRGLAEKQRGLAEKSAEESKAVLSFLKTKVLGVAKPKRRPGGMGLDVTVYDALNSAESQIEESFADQPLVEASIRNAMASTYFEVDVNAAIAQYERAFELRKYNLGIEHQQTLESMLGLSFVYGTAGRHSEALDLDEEIVMRATKTLGADHTFTVSAFAKLANSYQKAGRDDEAIAMKEKIMRLRKKSSGPEHEWTLNAMQSVAVAYLTANRFEDALAMAKQNLDMRIKAQGPEHPETIRSMYHVVNIYRHLGRRKEAVALGENTLILCGKVLPREDRQTIDTMYLLARIYSSMQRYDKAILLYEKVLPLRQKRFGVDYNTMRYLAVDYKESGQLDDAESLLRELISLRKKHTPGEWQFFYDQSLLGAVLTQRKQFQEAEHLLINSYEGLTSTVPKIETKWIKTSLYNLIILYRAWNKPEKATEWQAKLDAL